MKERPIIFSGLMVRALLDGRKSQTRRMLKPWPKRFLGTWRWKPKGFLEFHWDERMLLTTGTSIERACPYGQAGDRLWVRETWQRCAECVGLNYQATVNRPCNCTDCDAILGKWKPSIHMFREYARIQLEIVRVRAERLQDISEADAKTEGIAINSDLRKAPYGTGWAHPVSAYKELWESINGPGSWDANPWVWVVEFKRIDQGSMESRPTKGAA